MTLEDRKLAGIGYMIAGIAALAAMDAVGKWLVQSMPVHQILAVRSATASLVLLLLAPWVGGRSAFGSAQPGAHVLRALCALLAFLFFFTSVRYLPLADAVAVAFGGPFIVTALSVPILGERVLGRQWAAIGLGFFGMLLVVRPSGEGLRPAALLVIGSSFAYAFVIILTRWMARRSGGRERTFTFLIYTFAVHAVLASLYGLARSQPPFAAGERELALAALMGILALFGHFGITRAFQLAPVSVAAPFEYTALVWATLLGFVVFGEFPEPGVWLGVAVIVAAGLYTMRREAS